jgi:hypothetical protein
MVPFVTFMRDIYFITKTRNPESTKVILSFFRVFVVSRFRDESFLVGSGLSRFILKGVAVNKSFEKNSQFFDSVFAILLNARVNP